MGSKPSRCGSTRSHDSFSRGSISSSPRHASAESSPSSPESRRMAEFRQRYRIIRDEYNSLEQVTQALNDAGLESSNLIVAVDFTKSNEWKGNKCFNGRSLHHVGEGLINPYQHAISIIGKTLSRFDEDNLIPCFGFGDVTTHDRDVFSFYPDHRPCKGFEEALNRYEELVGDVKLAGPTSFGPIIETAIGIVNSSGCQYHVLLIIADGEVTRSVGTGVRQLSPQERSTMDAIEKASMYPLSIIIVGVGDGPWEAMKELDDNIQGRAFDNIQATLELPQLSNESGNTIKDPLPPPSANFSQRHTHPYPSTSSSFAPTPSTVYHPPSPNPENCPVCYFNRDVALGCGHMVCYECSNHLHWCPVCTTEITNRIRLSRY